MAKKKSGLRSFFSGRAGKPAKEPVEEQEWPSDSDGYNDSHPFDPSEVNRPPKLDAKTELELRRACSVIVENLKPSGHDLEDTRMQSDILVENADADSYSRGFMPRGAANIPQPGATWYQEGSTRSSQNVNPHTIYQATHKRISAYKISGPPPEYETTDDRSTSVLKAKQVQISRPIPKAESPLAPAATEAITSPDLTSPMPKRAPESKAVLAAHNDSSGSPSTYAASDNGVRSGSTGATSDNQTPLSISKRASENAKTESLPPAAAAGTWMKEEVDKRRQVEGESSQDLANNAIHATSTDLATDTAQNGTETRALPSESQRSNGVQGDQQTQADSDAPSGTLNGPFEQPIFVESPSQDSDPGAEIKSPNAALTSTLTEEEPEPQAPQQHSSSQNMDAAQLAESYRQALGHDEQATAAPGFTLKPKRHSKRLSKSKVSEQTSNDISNSRTSNSAASLGLSGASQNWPIPPKPRYMDDYVPQMPPLPDKHQFDDSMAESAPQMPPLPDKHQFDDSIVVKDFVPQTGPRVRVNPRYSADPSKRPVRPGDVEAADFDSFMSVLKEPSVPDADASDPDASSTSDALDQGSAAEADSSRPSSDARGVAITTDSAEENLDDERSTQSDKDTTSSETETKAVAPPVVPNGEPGVERRPQSQPAPVSQVSERPKSQPSSAVRPPSQPYQEAIAAPEQRNVIAPPVVSSPVVVISSRTSLSGHTHSRAQSLSRKPPRGLKRILSKLSSNERSNNYSINGFSPERRRVFDGYAPGAYVPGYGLNGGIEEDEEWFDEQACAAPVVGFGRGW